MSSRTPADHDDPTEVWVDVGGTFTDALVWTGNRRRSIKVLSSGRVHAAVTRVIAGDRIEVDLPLAYRIADFWVGAKVGVKAESAGGVPSAVVTASEVVAETASVVITLDRRYVDGDTRPLQVGDVLEFDAGIEAPVLATRVILRCGLSRPLPAVQVRLGTTRGTNALLTRSGARTCLVTTRGFGDLLAIGDQDRPELFTLDVRKFEPLVDRVIEVDERVAADGETLIRIDTDSLRRDLAAARQAGIESLAICLMNATVNPAHECVVADVAREVGFTEVSRSSEVVPLIKIVSRAETTALDAYLNPILKHYLDRVGKQFGLSTDRGGASSLRLMTSNGNLVRPESFRGRDSILSGPAGGGVALAKISESAGVTSAIGLDMGGTSTDVSRFHGGLGRRFESTVSGCRVMTPMMDIHTVAAGGGSICDFSDGRIVVGPGSAGADPGPACYGRQGPLTVTDVNLLLGRIVADRFPIPLDRDAARTRIGEVVVKMRSESSIGQTDERPDTDKQPDASETFEALAAGFLDLAVTHMVEAVKKISAGEGVDVRRMTLIGFGGAAGQNLCQVAEALQVKRVIDHPDAAVLSALGMGLASIGRIETRGVAIDWSRPSAAESLRREASRTFDAAREAMRRELDDASLRSALDSMSPEPPAASGGGANAASGGAGRAAPLRCDRTIDVRYTGTDSPLQIPLEPLDSVADRFAAKHQRVFGYTSPGRDVEVIAVRCEITLDSVTDGVDPNRSPRAATGAAPTQRLYVGGQWVEATVHDRATLLPGTVIDGPALIASDFSTFVLHPHWRGVVQPGDGVIVADLVAHSKSPEHLKSPEHSKSSEQPNPPGAPKPSGSGDGRDSVLAARDSAMVDPVLVEIVARRVQGIADSMGEALRRTASSVNVKERRDYSCAVFRGDGVLVANAPHVPVHLGAMGHTVRHLIASVPKISAGDCFVTNDPFAGGSHLPDVTVISPVFCSADVSSGPDFFVASRAHHAEIGGRTPGSMPPDGTTLADEGVLIRCFTLTRAGKSFERQLGELLAAGPYPSRDPAQNIADIRAQQAAGREGEVQLGRLAEEYSVPTIDALIDRSLELAGDSVARLIASLPADSAEFEDRLDDGSRIRVKLTRDGGRLEIDFTGSHRQHPGCFNATPAIVNAAVLYVLRSICPSGLPLCDGVLRDVDVVIPPGILSPTAGATPAECPAVVAGNVETSQRIVDVLIGAFGVAAASQGTMNNLLIGDSAFGYYETICGGAGATANGPGADAVQTHMTNTRITDPEVLESRLPVRLREFSIRRNSGGDGRHRGGDGVTRHLVFLRGLTVSLITGRRTTRPYGAAGGSDGAAGVNTLIRRGVPTELPPSVTFQVAAGDELRLQTPGGGGWGDAATHRRPGGQCPPTSDSEPSDTA